jgi:hypothetical protein
MTTEQTILLNQLVLSKANVRRTTANEAVLQARARPILEALKPWLEAKLATVSGKSKLAEAIRYTLSRILRDTGVLFGRSPGRFQHAPSSATASGSCRSDKPSRRARSSALNFIHIFLTAISFPATKHLHRRARARQIQKKPRIQTR